MRAEILITDDTRGRGVQILRGMAETAAAHGIEPIVRRNYTAAGEWLLMWGAGAPERYRLFKQHVKAGGHAIAFDMGYWRSGRGYDVYGMNRVTIDAMHPQAYVMRRDWPADRLAQTPVAVDNRFDPDGHIVLAGLGPKTCDQYGIRLGEWEQAKLAEIKAAFPRRRIVFRPKPGNPYYGLPVAMDNTTPIDELLRGAALVVCRHSNVAVDAIRMGVPAVCEDGIAAAVCPRELALHQPIAPALRDRFLTNLAWFQWTIAEAWQGPLWPFLKELLCESITGADARFGTASTTSTPSDTRRPLANPS